MGTMIRKATTGAAAGALLASGALIGTAAPANAAVGDLYDCKTTTQYAGPGLDLRTTKCKKQLSSIRGVYEWVTTSSKYVVRKGTRM